MEGNLILGIIQVVMIVVMGFLAWLRMPFQNTLDRAGAMKDLSESLDKALERQKDLERRIQNLNDILKEQNYSVTMVFQLGEQPMVKSVTIQPVTISPVIAKS